MPIPTSPDTVNNFHDHQNIISTIRRQIEWITIERWKLSGVEIHSGEKINILYTGVRLNKNYFASIVFDSNFTEEYLGYGHLWHLMPHPAKEATDCSMVIIEGLKAVGNLWLKSGYSYIPGWINGNVYLHEDISAIIKNRSARSDINRIKRNQLTYEVSGEVADFNQFYYDMYLPFVQARHGKSAIIHTYEDLCKRFRKGFLILIKKDGETIAGSLISRNKAYGRLGYIGIKNGENKYVQDGAIIALYYYPLTFLHKLGCRKINVGATRAFLQDRILHYKKKWGYQVEGNSPAGFFFKVTRASPGVRSFLHNNPYITADKKGNSLMLFSESPEVPQEVINTLRINYIPEGLDWITVNNLENDGRIRQIGRIPL